MDEEKKGFMAWVKEHKKELILAGVSIGVIIAIVLGIKNNANCKCKLDTRVEWARFLRRRKLCPRMLRKVPLACGSLACGVAGHSVHRQRQGFHRV
jgi:predicted membrane chloride channel (bestrophin family)